MATTTSATAKNYNEFFKSFSDFSVPGMDFNNFFSVQRRNLEALTAANQAAAEAAQAISRRQVELLQSQVERFLETAREVMSAGSPEAGATKQADLAKELFECSLSGARELAEMASKSNVEVLDILNKRFVCSMEDMNGIMKRKKAS